MSNRLVKLSLAIAIGLSVMGCSPTEDKKVSTANQAINKEEQMYKEVQKLSGFNSGNIMAATQVYVIFDPQCPHCGHFWQEVKEIKNVNFKWIPVGFLNPKSIEQAGVFLNAHEPVKIMNVHEDLLEKKLGGIVVGEVSPEAKEKVKLNTEFFKNNLNSVPTLFFQNVQTKKYQIFEGGMPKEQFLKLVGLAS